MRTSTNAVQTEPVKAVTAVLIDALRALDAAGRPEPASRLAGRAYAALRRCDAAARASRARAARQLPDAQAHPKH